MDKNHSTQQASIEVPPTKTEYFPDHTGPIPRFVPKKLAALALLFLLLILIIVGYKTVQDLQKPQQSNNLVSSVSPAPSNESLRGLKIYSNPEFNFQLEYPKEIFLYESSDVIINSPRLQRIYSLSINIINCVVIRASGCGDSFQISVYKNSNSLELSKWIDKEILINEVSPSPRYNNDANGKYCYERAKREEININGNSAIVYTFSNNQIGYFTKCKSNASFDASDPYSLKETFIQYKDYIYKIEIHTKTLSQSEKIYNQILNSLLLSDQIKEHSVTKNITCEDEGDSSTFALNYCKEQYCNRVKTLDECESLDVIKIENEKIVEGNDGFFDCSWIYTYDEKMNEKSTKGFCQINR